MPKTPCEQCGEDKDLIGLALCIDCFNILLQPYGAYIEVDNA